MGAAVPPENWITRRSLDLLPAGRSTWASMLPPALLTAALGPRGHQALPPAARAGALSPNPFGLATLRREPILARWPWLGMTWLRQILKS